MDDVGVKIKMILIMVALGGAVGSILRYLTSVWAVQYLGSAFPYGTLIVNVIGSFFIGLVLAMLETNILVSPHWRPLIMVGILGGFTTFSSFSLDTLNLLIQAQYLKAGLYLLLNVVLGLIAVSIGYFMLKH
ncbi:fluoride efflux transporter CrcB [Utexia brackfieldae]|uniref:fluoride efflux transporter CrcB n=1 Tax=Utexia brackfieldae TaxID=3074108 RepID=UPI00370D0D3F